MSNITRCADYLEAIKARRNMRLERVGFESGIADLDDIVWFRKQIVAVVTGHSGCGKSELIDQLCMNWAILHGYKTLYFSPENSPAESHYVKHIERYTGKKIYHVTDQELAAASEFISKYFSSIEFGEHETASITKLLETASEQYDKEKYDFLVLDPWNECDFNMEEREDLYISKKISEVKKFVKPRDISCIIVAHPRTPREKITDDKGRQDYPPPKLHEISGGGNWKNKVELGISCHRHPEDNFLRVQIQKRKDKSYGNLGEVIVDYDYATGRFKGTADKMFILPNAIQPPF